MQSQCQDMEVYTLLSTVIIDGTQCTPKIESTGRRVTVPYDQPLDLSCQLEESRDNVKYSWTIRTEFEQDLMINSGATLHRDRGMFLNGIYTCRAENQCGHDVADFAVKISGNFFAQCHPLLI